jgi:fumarate hydratase class I
MEYDFYPFEKPLEIQTLKSGKKILEINSNQIETLIKKSFETLSFFFTKEHLENLVDAALKDDSSDNDRYVCACLLENAKIAAEGKLPICQDTGIANIFGWKNSSVVINGLINNAISNAVQNTYKNKKLRLSTTIPDSIFEEHDPKNNLPANIMIFDENEISDEDEISIKFLCCAKGGGSSNKTIFFQGTKANLNEDALNTFLEEKIKSLGTSACPPYTLSVVLGGLSPEQNLLALKLATCGAFEDKQLREHLTKENSLFSNSLFDETWKQKVINIAENTGLGAQFGGKRMVLDASVLRLPRHGASCPISVGLSCSAHRNLFCKITKDGFYVQKTVKNLEDILNYKKAISFKNNTDNGTTVEIDTNKSIQENLKMLSQIKCGQRVLISGPILVARDAAHAKWKTLYEKTNKLPDYCTKYPVCYAGPAQTPEGYVTGSFGPTTAGRMDAYADLLMKNNCSRITIAKGNRSSYFKNCCKKYGSFYLGTLGGAAALIAKTCVQDVKILDYPELGMEAVRLVTVKHLPAFLLTDDKGNDFYEK